jgi:cytochrome b pre-mRNA-processing protein 3
MFAFLNRLWPGPAPDREAAVALYRKAVEKAREPAFYRDLAVPDTLDGRFDMIVIHTGLTIRRLRDAPEGDVARRVAQQMFDHMFTDFDRSLREMGVGDMGVGPRIKKMGRAWYARAATYDAALDAAIAGDRKALETALRETLYRGQPEAGGIPHMADYLLRADAHLKAQPVAALARGDVDWHCGVGGGAR